MDSKGQALDNVRTKRFFRGLKYEDVYIKSHEDVRALRLGVGAYILRGLQCRPSTPGFWRSDAGAGVHQTERRERRLSPTQVLPHSDVQEKGDIRSFLHPVS